MTNIRLPRYLHRLLTISPHVQQLLTRGIYTITHLKPDFVEMTTEGIPYSFDNRSGKWNVWNLSLFLDGAETKARESGVFMNWSSFPAKSVSLVMIKLVQSINPKVYNFDFKENTHLRITTQLNEPGTTSYSITTILTNNDSEVLVERYAKLGRLDNETRRPVKNPDEFLKAFAYLKNKGSPPALTKTDIPKTPTDCFKWCLTTRYSDLDSKMHANQSLYIKSCIDCVTHASMNDKLVHFHGDMIWYPVTYLAINYLGESFASDELVVNMWQNREDASLFNFSIYNSTKQVAYIVFKFETLRLTTPFTST